MIYTFILILVFFLSGISMFKLYYDLAGRYGKDQLLFGIIGYGVFIIGSFIAVFSLYLFSDSFSEASFFSGTLFIIPAYIFIFSFIFTLVIYRIIDSTSTSKDIAASRGESGKTITIVKILLGVVGLGLVMGAVLNFNTIQDKITDIFKVDKNRKQSSVVEKDKGKRTQYANQIDRIFTETRRQKHTLTEDQEYALSYVGDVYNVWNAELTKQERLRTESKFYFDVDVFPTRFFNIGKIIPTEILADYKGELRDCIFIFRNKDFPDIEFKYKALVDFATDVPTTKLDRRPKAKKGVTIYNIPYSKRKLMGKITRINKLTGQIISEKNFESSYDKANIAHDITFENPSKSITIEENFIDEYDRLATGSSDSLTLRTIFKNLKIVNSKRLIEKGYYMVGQVYLSLYSQEDVRPENPLKTSQGYLIKYLTSNEDQTTLCSIQGENYEIRYFINQESKRVVGMQMLTSFEGTDEMERLELFAK